MGSSYENVHQQKFPAIRYIDSALDYGIIILFISVYGNGMFTLRN